MAKISVANPVQAAVIKKRKRKPKLSKSKSKNKITNIKTSDAPQVTPSVNTSEDGAKCENGTAVQIEEKKVVPSVSAEQFAERFPVFKDEGLIKKFLGVTMTNNQKGRIRQTLRDSLKGTSEVLLPDIIHTRIQSIVKETATLTDAELRKIRILYNMLKSIAKTKPADAKVKKNKKKNKKDKVKKNESETDVKEVIADKKVEKKIDEEENDTENEIVEKQDSGVDEDVNMEKDKKPDKVKGPKRYVVFVGNLPLDVDKEKIMKHFKEFKDHIVDVRIPKPKEGKKSSIAYVELKNELCYELALSKHHSMFANKRINVLYTTQQNSKVSKTEAKGKAAKLVALQKTGKLAGSIPLNRKRSQRRMKAKLAQAKLEADS